MPRVQGRLANEECSWYCIIEASEIIVIRRCAGVRSLRFECSLHLSLSPSLRQRFCFMLCVVASLVRTEKTKTRTNWVRPSTIGASEWRRTDICPGTLTPFVCLSPSHLVGEWKEPYDHQQQQQHET